MHQPKNSVAATLQRNVEVRHEGPALGTIGNQLVTEQIGFQAADAIAADALYPIQGLDQVNETLAGCLAKVADVHTRQHNFLSAFSCSLFGLPYQRLNVRIAAEATGVWNGAIGAEIVAAVLYFQKVAGAVATRAAGRKRLDVLCFLDMIF